MFKVVRGGLGLLLLTLVNSLFAQTVEDARQDHPWSTFQGGPDHKGYVPIYLSNEVSAVEADVNDLNPRPLWQSNQHRVPWTHTDSHMADYYGFDQTYNFDPDDDATFNRNEEEFIYIEPLLNQLTVVDDRVYITNYGYRVPHRLWIRSSKGEEPSGTLIGGYHYQFDLDLAFDQSILFPDEGEIYPNNACPVSQSQPAVFGQELAIQSNLFFSSSNLFCNDELVDNVEGKFRHFPMEFYKNSEGIETVGLTVTKDKQHEIDTHYWDTFSAPTIVNEVMYGLAGGIPGRRDRLGLIAYSMDRDNPIKKWDAGVTGDWIMAPSDKYSPTVALGKVLAFTSKRFDTDQSYAEEAGGRLWMFNRFNGEYASHIEDYSYLANVAPIRYGEYHVGSETLSPVFQMERSVAYYDGVAVYTSRFRSGLAGSRGSLIAKYIGSEQSTINNDWSIQGEPLEEGVSLAEVYQGYYGQPSISENRKDPDNGPIVYVAHNNQLVGRYLNQGGLALRYVSADEPWYWQPPAGEILLPPFVVTETHAFVSTDKNVYMVDLNLTVAPENRTVWSISSMPFRQFPVGGDGFSGSENPYDIAFDTVVAPATQTAAPPPYEPNASYISLNYNRLYISTSTHWNRYPQFNKGNHDFFRGDGGRPAIRVESWSGITHGFHDISSQRSNARVMAFELALAEEQTADLAMTLGTVTYNDGMSDTNNPTVVETGGLLTYPVTVVNNGPETAGSVSIQFYVPPSFQIALQETNQSNPQVECNQSQANADLYRCLYDSDLSAIPAGNTFSFSIVGRVVGQGGIELNPVVNSNRLDIVDNNNSASYQVIVNGGDNPTLILDMERFELSNEYAQEGDYVEVTFLGLNSPVSENIANDPSITLSYGGAIRLVRVESLNDPDVGDMNCSESASKQSLYCAPVSGVLNSGARMGARAVVQVIARNDGNQGEKLTEENIVVSASITPSVTDSYIVKGDSASAQLTINSAPIIQLEENVIPDVMAVDQITTLSMKAINTAEVHEALTGAVFSGRFDLAFAPGVGNIELVSAELPGLNGNVLSCTVDNATLTFTCPAIRLAGGNMDQDIEVTLRVHRPGILKTILLLDGDQIESSQLGNGLTFETETKIISAFDLFVELDSITPDQETFFIGKHFKYNLVAGLRGDSTVNEALLTIEVSDNLSIEEVGLPSEFGSCTLVEDGVLNKMQCQIIGLANGLDGDINIPVTVKALAQGSAMLVKAQIESTTGQTAELNLTDNQVTSDPVNVLSSLPVDLSVSASAVRTSVLSNFNYNINATVLSDEGTLTDAKITVNLDNDLVIVSTTPDLSSLPECTSAGQQIMCTGLSISAENPFNLVVTVTSNSAESVTSNFILTGDQLPDTELGQPGERVVDVTTLVEQPIDLAVALSDSTTSRIQVGNYETYRATVTNNSIDVAGETYGGSAENVTLTISTTSAMTIVGVSDTVNCAIVGSNSAICSLAELALDESFSVDVDVQAVRDDGDAQISFEVNSDSIENNQNDNAASSGFLVIFSNKNFSSSGGSLYFLLLLLPILSLSRFFQRNSR